MNWDAIGAAGEWAGAVVVVATLVYLAKQIHQQNQIAKYSATQSLMDGFQAHISPLGTNTELNALLSKGDFEPESLSDAEARQYQFFYRSYLLNMLKAYRAYELGLLEAREWNDLASEFSKNLETPGGAAFRRTNITGYEQFWEIIDELRFSDFKRPDYDLGRSYLKSNE